MYGSEISGLAGKVRNFRPLPHERIRGVERSLILKLTKTREISCGIKKVSRAQGKQDFHQIGGKM
jgi:hypothetical protein